MTIHQFGILCVTKAQIRHIVFIRLFHDFKYGKLKSIVFCHGYRRSSALYIVKHSSWVETGTWVTIVWAKCTTHLPNRRTFLIFQYHTYCLFSCFHTTSRYEKHFLYIKNTFAFTEIIGDRALSNKNRCGSCVNARSALGLREESNQFSCTGCLVTEVTLGHFHRLYICSQWCPWAVH